jgi:hypothetical protein
MSEPIEFKWHLVSAEPIIYAYGTYITGEAVYNIKAEIMKQKDGSWRWLAGDFAGQGIEPSSGTAKAAAMYWMGQNEKG